MTVVPAVTRNDLRHTIEVGLLLAASFLPRNARADEPQVPDPVQGGAITATVDAPPTAGPVRSDPLFESKTFSAAESADQALILSVYERLPETARKEYLTLLDRHIRGTDQSALFDKDFFRKERTIDSLNTLLKSELQPELSPFKAEIITSLLQELARPGELNQSKWGVCGTSMVYGLYRDYPGEAIRLNRGLLLPEGEVALLKPNTLLKRAPFSLLPDDGGTRSITERVLFSALMDLANGTDHHYCNVCDLHFHEKQGTTFNGLNFGQQMTLYKSIYNISDNDCFAVTNRGSWSDFEYYTKTYLPGLLPAALRWATYENNSSSQNTLHLTNLRDDQANDHLRITTVRQTNTTTTGIGSHRIDIIKIENNRVYYRNLHGPTTLENGTNLLNPPRRVEDKNEGIESMALSEFKDRVLNFIIPLRNQRLPAPQYR